MTSDSNDSNKTTQKLSSIESSHSSICKKIWSYIYIVIVLITFVGSCIQLACCVVFLLITIFAAICVVCRVQSVTKYLDDFTGLSIASQINRETDHGLFLTMIAVIAVASFPVYISEKLCKGLSKSIERYIWSYIMCGVIFFVIRIWLWVIYSCEHNNIPIDKTFLFCGLYALYLLLLVINCFEIRRRAETDTSSLKISSFVATLRSNHGTTIMYGPV